MMCMLLGYKVFSIGTQKSNALNVSQVSLPEYLQHPQHTENNTRVINPRDSL